MRRSLVLLVFLLLAVPARAGAISLPVPYGAEMAVSESYAYWIAEKPKGCKNCAELRRTRLDDGTTSPVMRVERGDLGDLRANATTAVVTVSYGRWIHKSRVVAVTDAGSRSVLARGEYRSRSKRRCGSMVEAGAISQDNEVSWQQVTAGSAARRCDNDPSTVRLSFHAGFPGGASRVLAPPQGLDEDIAFNATELIENRQLGGFNGRLLLVDKDEAGLELRDVATGQVFPLGPDLSYLGRSARLSAGGSVAADFWGPEDDGATALFVNPTSADPLKSIRVGLEQSDFDILRFCGGTLMQIVPGMRKITLVRRDLGGAELGRSTVRTRRYIDRVSFECNSRTGVLRYSQLSDDGDNIKRVSTTVAIP